MEEIKNVIKAIFHFVNDNAIVVLFITIISDFLLKKSDRRYEEKKENRKEKKQQFFDKAELHIAEKELHYQSKPNICLFLSDFGACLTDDKNGVVFKYRKDILNDKKYKHLRFYLQNIGKADISQLDICVTSQRTTMLCDIDYLKDIVKGESINYNYCYDRKIIKGEIILIDIAYLEDSRICNMPTGELELLFRDSYGNLYAQLFLIHQNNIYEPRKITGKEYKSYITVDTALECFKKPWMW